MSDTNSAADSSDFNDWIEQQQARAFSQVPSAIPMQPGQGAVPLTPQPTTVAPPTPQIGALPAGSFTPGTYSAPGPTPDQHGELRSLGDEAWASTLQMGRGVLGAVSASSRALGADPGMVAWIEQQKQALAGHIADTVATMSPQAQAAMHASMFGNGTDVPTPGQVGYAKYVGAQVAEFLPQIPVMVLSGIPGVGPALTALIMGATDAGSAYNDLVDNVDKATPEQLQKSPAYAQLRAQGYSDLEARKQLVGQLAPSMMAIHFGIGAAAGVGTGGLLTRGAVGTAERGALARFGIGAVEGAGVMGAQGAAEETANERTQQQLGQQPGYSGGDIAKAGAAGAVGGAVLGGVGGMLHGHAMPEIEPEREPVLPDDQHDAMVEALGQTEPEGLPPPKEPLAEDEASSGPTPAAPAVGPTPAPESPTAEAESQTTPPAVPPVEPTPPAQEPLAETPTVVDTPAPEQSSAAAAPAPPAAPSGPQASEEPEAAAPPAISPGSSPPAPQRPVDALRAAAQAKRAAQKAKLAPPGEPTRGDGAVTVDEAPEAAEPTPVGKAAPTQAEVMMALRAGLPGLARDVTPLRKGADVTPVLGRVADAIESSAKSKGDGPETVAQAIAEWGKANPGVLAGTKTRGADLADRMMQRLTGKSVPRNEAMVRDIVSEPARQRSLVEKEGTAQRGEDNELTPDDKLEDYAENDRIAGEAPEEGEGSSQGVADYVGANRERVDTTHAERVANNLLDQVLAGTMTPAEAHETFGEKPEGSPGRPRAKNLTNFAAYLDHRIAEGEDPATLLRLHDHIVRAGKDETLTPKQREVLTKGLQREMNLSDPDVVQRMKDARDELEDPIGAMAKRENAARAALTGHRVHAREAAKPDGITPLSSRYVRASRDPRLNAFIDRAMAASERDGMPYTLHDALRGVINNAGMRAEMRPLHELARQLLRSAPDVPVMSAEAAHYADHIDADTMRKFNEGSMLGQMQETASERRPLRVVLAVHSDSHVENLLHEALHTVTSRYINAMEENDPTHPDLRALHAIYREVGEHANQDIMDGGVLSRDASLRHDVQYALANNHELHTMLMSHPGLQAFLATRRASDGFRATMRELGYAPREGDRSVWRAFVDWTRRALGLRQPVSASEYTLLDHVMRPTHDVMTGAEKFNRLMQGGVSDDVSTHERMGMPSRKELLDHIDAPGMPDKLRTATLASSPLDAIVDRYGSVFEPSNRIEVKGNPLTAFRAAVEKAQHVAHLFRTDRQDRVNTLITRLSGPEGRSLGQLMVDSTLLKARLGDDRPDANAHLDTPEEQAALAELQRRFGALSDAGQSTYKGVRDYYIVTRRLVREARLEGLIRSALPDISGPERDELMKALRTEASTRAFLKDADNSPLAAAFGQGWAGKRGILRGIGRLHAEGFVKGDFFPLRRFGDYVVRYGDPSDPEHYGVEMFEKRSVAEARRAELAKEGVDNLSAVMDHRESALEGILPHNPVVGEFENALKNNPAFQGQAQDVMDLLKTILLDHASTSQAALTNMRRRFVKGASPDAARILAGEFLNTGYHLGRLAAGPDRAQALANMKLVRDDLGQHGGVGQQIQASQTIRELEQRVATGDDAAGLASRLARRATGLGFVQSLMSPSHMLTASIEAQTNAMSLLGARHGAVRAGAALTKALADVSPTLAKAGFRNTLTSVGKGLKAADWDLSHLARDRLIAKGNDAGRMRDLFIRADQAGLIDHTQTAELRRIANPAGVVPSQLGKAWQRFLDFNAAGAHAVNVANKAAVLKAAYDLEFRRTANHDRAADYAVQQVRRVMPNYNLANKSRISTSRGPLGTFAAPLTQFKQYGLHMYSLLGNLAQASMHGASSAERWEARKAFAGILATHAAMAGVITLIADPLRLVGGLYDWISGAKRPHNYQNDVRGFLADTFGPEVGEIVARGLPHLAGIDIHRRVGLANLLELPDIDSYDAKGFMTALGTMLIGASGEDAATMAAGVGKVMNGDFADGLLSIVPRPVRDIMKASNLATTGVTSGGKVIMPADHLSSLDVLAQGLGFQPADVSEAREARSAVLDTRREASDERSQLIEQWLGADPADRAAVMANIRQFNASRPYATITVDQLMRRLAAAKKAPGPLGISAPRRGAQQLMQAGSFANVP